MAAQAGVHGQGGEGNVVRARCTWLFCVLITLMFLALGARLVQLQVMQHEEMAVVAARQILGTVRDRDKRGVITDSRGIVLATSVAVRACAVDPKLMIEASSSFYGIDSSLGALPGLQAGRPGASLAMETAATTPTLERLGELLNLSKNELDKVKRQLVKRQTLETEEGIARQPMRFLWIKRELAEAEWRTLSDSITAAKKQAADARNNQRRWRKIIGQAKVARNAEVEKTAREAASGWRRVALEADARFAGVFFPAEYERRYPQGKLAAHILGFTGRGDKDSVEGREGVERTFDVFLRGVALNRVVARDARSRALSTLASDNRTTDGMTVELTIDSVVQSIVEEELQQSIDKLKVEFPAVTGHAIVMDPFTGDILAIANYPTFDPNEPGGVEARSRNNDVVQAVQEPGSTFKPLLIAASIEEKLATFDESIDCSTFRMDNGRTVKDIHPYNRHMPLEMALMKSSNPAMVRVGLRLGPEKMREYVLKYGFGEKTGRPDERGVNQSTFPGEVRGKVTNARNWSLYTMGSVPMGYEINVTTLQMAAAYSVFANGGLLPRPNIIKAVYDQAGGLALRTEPEMRHRVISKTTAAQMRQVLRKVVTEGTGRRANIKEYELGGKTGTANMIANAAERAAGVRGYSNKRHTANFVALAPWDKPRAVICVSIRDTGKYGGEASSPVVAGIARRVLAYWGVPTTNGETVKNELLPLTGYEPPKVPEMYTIGAEDDDNAVGEVVDPRWIEELIDDPEAEG